MRRLKLLLILSVPLLLISQPYCDVVNIRYQNYLSNNTTQYLAESLLPLKLKDQNYLLLGSNYNRIQFHGSRLENFSLFVGGVINLPLSPKDSSAGTNWSSMFLLIPKFGSAPITFNSNSFQPSSVFLLMNQVSSTLKLKFGLYYSREFFGHFYIPLLGYEWKVSDRLNMFGILPASANMEYMIKDNLYTQLKFKSTTASYIQNPLESGNFIREGHKFWGHTQFTGSLEYYIKKYILLYIEVGRTAWVQYNSFEGSSIAIIQPYNFIDESIFINIGTALRVRY